MVGGSHGVSEPSAFWPTFGDQQTIAGIRLLNLVDWVCASDRVLGGDKGPPDGMPLIAVPPVQRTAVWRPKQVLDLWDSLMRGLPIGAFYLLDGAPKLVRLRQAGSTETGSQLHSADRLNFALLDGQQRMRAILAGAYGPAEGKLCLWVDLGAEGAKQAPCLRVTSKAQPFGYDGESGNKLRMDQRRNARRLIEPCPKEHPLLCGDRRAYDADLFDREVKLDGNTIEKPPRPYVAANDKAFTGKTFKLHDLLNAWRCRPSDAEGVTTLRGALPASAQGDAEIGPALIALHEAFKKVEEAQVALLRVDPRHFPDQTKTLLDLFARIGAGGTPLSFEERLFSIYKHYVPEIRDAVYAIHEKAGRVLPPTKIVAAALRIANASDDKRPQYTVPSAGDFATQMAGDPASKFRQTLDRLIPTTKAVLEHRGGPLSNAFGVVKRLLSHDPDRQDAFWLPDVMLVALPAELWQVLVFWMDRRSKILGQDENIDAYREELVRFALFWHFFVWNDEKAARWAFRHLRDAQDITHFPSSVLYQDLIGVEGGDRCAYALVDSSEFTRRLFKKPSSSWRTDQQRFGEGKERNEVGAHWWWSGRKVLPWLQREYIVEAFPGYQPLSDHEDDLPYDVDHICPRADWGDDWRSLSPRIHDDAKNHAQRMRDGRDAVGNGIGNLRLVDASTNKGDQDADISKKMPFAVTDDPSEEDKGDMARFAFPSDDHELWKQVSRSGRGIERQWNEARLAAFQQAVEQRAAWLYNRFYNELDYAKWVPVKEESVNSGEQV